ncbi:MAG: 50S ribosomal protein L17 [Nitrospirae bacterium RIFCSPLOW2_12_42_9]|uniref:Large ribosomal subunit protein bL17 n=1 Tax=uncultured Nitrospirae bacterium Rifle_16ft_4_minimus_4901 TaxID=1665132 RepID=A0A0H4TTZ6_9BACT|nr:50S ribosomal protein L17, large subunit ribosomal protein L17 [uncultured Nitrospirae bacterium Rifle_16ft_4_minimus_4901]OGW15909.1 MAG: 50S ribosomal protein L17 [Nitrospirae bacterium GWA2_42_11]OGW54772.1 MAG: 50S ribosomal protein L17 [Nitrospirae bacterium RIFCSPLOWO2_02_42_7]OGW58468.1 MAG: 50S ribosomal protein L17 [Nitrospirae bacterium RIFCSPLOW2_12_42_9]OGW58902.1 MAG: 50S ribosomal protein L17 [Nitrospirae bacterium RIFCSPHIGHO2_02_FULL_42_12]HAS17089.1 50S ribosomal protein L1
MRHRKAGKQLGRDTKHRRSLFRNLVTSLFEHGKIETTITKAKAIRPIAERMITIGKRGGLHERRRALAYIKSESVVVRLFDSIAPQFHDKAGGYLKIVRTRQRLGDSAPMAIIELIGVKKEESKKSS